MNTGSLGRNCFILSSASQCEASRELWGCTSWVLEGKGLGRWRGEGSSLWRLLDELCVIKSHLLLSRKCLEAGAGICHSQCGAQAEQEPEERANEVKERRRQNPRFGIRVSNPKIFPGLFFLQLQEGPILVARLSSCVVFVNSNLNVPDSKCLIFGEYQSLVAVLGWLERDGNQGFAAGNKWTGGLQAEGSYEHG